MRAVIRFPHKLLWFADGPSELYDVREDPGQVRNLAADPKHRAAREELSRRVSEWMRATGDPRAAGWTDFWDAAPYSGPKARG